MKKVLVTGNDTDIGKTRVIRRLTEYLCAGGKEVQVVKIVETGVKEPSDAPSAVKGTVAQPHTLFRYELPLGPVCASRGDFHLGLVKEKIKELKEVEWRLYEAAGGFACPLDAEGADGRELAAILGIDYLVMVVEHRLGAINQARLLENYAEGLSCKKGFWLCEKKVVSEMVDESNLKEIGKLSAGIWGKNEDIYTKVFG